MIKRFNKKGFTLVEIIVVLVILAILAAIAVPSVLGYVEEAKKEKYIAEARSIYTVIQVEETKLANEIDYTDKPSQYNKAEDYMYAKICDKSKIHEEGEGIVYKKTGIHLLSIQEDGNGEISIFWKSEDGKTIWAMIYRNKEIKIEEVYDHSL
jgi:prepilin-type N-terminal cleavage/methylation domain-containing protein